MSSSNNLLLLHLLLMAINVLWAKFPVVPIDKASLASLGTCATSGDSATENCPCTSLNLPPIIFVPGFIGSKMYLVGHGDVPYPAGLAYCKSLIQSLFGRKHGNGWSMKGWLNPVLLPGNTTIPQLRAWIPYLMQLQYDPSKKSYSNQANVSTDFLAHQPFGSTCPTACWASDSVPGLCDLSTATRQEEAYFGNLFACLAKFGYVTGCNLFAAPYDWRLSPKSPKLDGFYANLTKLIEHSVEKRGKKAILVAHSMGNLMLIEYLNRRMSKKWQNKYLNFTINVAAPYGGIAMFIDMILSGDAGPLSASLGVDPGTIRQFMRSLPSVATMLPNPLGFHNKRQILATIGHKNYTVADVDKLLEMAGIPYAYQVYQEMSTSIAAQKYTPMYCAYACIENSTTQFYNYPNGINSSKIQQLGSGDLFVNCDSLRVCRKWKDRGEPMVRQVKEFSGSAGAQYQPLAHFDFVGSEQFCDFIKSIIVGI